MEPLLTIEDLKINFNMLVGSVLAVDGVSFHINQGETLGVVGESGCGKSVSAMSLLQLIPMPPGELVSGRAMFEGQDLFKLSKEEIRKVRGNRISMIFQDPYSSLNPRLTVLSIVGDALKAHGMAANSEIADRVVEILEKVGIRRDKLRAFPHEFSGGQRQRIGIARALILQPKLIICDEPVSALVVSIQAQVINLLSDLKSEFQLSYLMIAHDLSVVNHVSNRVAVMYLGKIIELASNHELLANALHPYTQALISAIPVLDPDRKKERIILQGDLPSPVNPPSGCRFHTRCWKAMEICKTTEPRWVEIEPEHYTMCHLHEACRPAGN